MSDRIPPGPALVTHHPGLTLSGHSDDIVCLEGIVTDEFHPQAGQPARFLVGTTDAAPGVDAHGVYVVMDYAPDEHTRESVWTAAIVPLDEGVTCPWTISAAVPPNPGGPSNSGSSTTGTPRVTIHCPAGTPVRVDTRRAGRPEEQWHEAARWDADGRRMKDE